MSRLYAVLLVAAVVAGCAVDDSGPINSVWRPANGAATWSEVIYVTDRQPDPAAAAGFSNRWAGRPSCGIAHAIVPAALAPDEPFKSGYVDRTTPAECARNGLKLGGAIALIEAAAAAKHCRSVFLFVHGFHTALDGATVRAAQIAADAQTGCVAAAFSWSAELTPDRYVADLEHSDYSQPLFAEFLRELSESGLRVTVMAHSMGVRLTLMTLAGLAQEREPPRPGFIAEMVLAAGDVGIDPGNNDYEKLMAAAALFVRRTTIYVSSSDTVLDLSRREHGGVPRMGIAPDLSAGPSDSAHEIDIIDASEARADRLDHSYYAMSPAVMNDLTLVLNGVPLSARLGGIGVWPATLSCEGACAAHYRIRNGGGQRLSTKLILHLLPAVPMIR